MSGTGGGRSDEVRSDAAEGAAGEESSERTGDERPYRFRDGLGHLEPVDSKFHVVSFLVGVLLLHSVVLCRMQCLSGCGQYRPNVTPNTESAVGSRDRTARQSLDCLRVRPLRTPALSVMVRPASGSVLPTLARGALAALRRIPAPPEPFRPA